MLHRHNSPCTNFCQDERLLSHTDLTNGAHAMVLLPSRTGLSMGTLADRFESTGDCKLCCTASSLEIGGV